MVYLNFPDWSQASAAQPYYMDATPSFSGYHCAPEPSPRRTSGI
jgi:hypothetical protein